MISTQDRFRGCLLAGIISDAVGTTQEFKPRSQVVPIYDMVGGGPFSLKAGQFTDDSSMMWAMAESLVEKNGFDAKDQLEKYVQWYRTGKYSSTGELFDIGIATREALEYYEMSGSPESGSTDEYSSGNGSIMRLAPIPMFYHGQYENLIKYAGESSKTTHGSTKCVDSCKLMAIIIDRALSGQSKEEILSPVTGIDFDPDVDAISQGKYKTKSYDEVGSNGYVVTSLEFALWCFYTSDTYEDATLLATNAGGDSDTNACVMGQLFGAHVGIQGIPEGWLNKLYMKDTFIELADQLGKFK